MEEMLNFIREYYKKEEYITIGGNSGDNFSMTLYQEAFRYSLNFMAAQRLIAMCELVRCTSFKYNEWKTWYEQSLGKDAEIKDIAEYINRFNVTIIRIQDQRIKLISALADFYKEVHIVEACIKGNEKQEQSLNDFSRYTCISEITKIGQLAGAHGNIAVELINFQTNLWRYFRKLYYAPHLKNIAIENELLQMLNPKRFRESSLDKKDFESRNPFESDYFRVVTSAPVRRLQDKTQIFPQEKSDFVRRRLTHSMEVAAIGRQLGRMVEEKLIERGALFETGDYVKKYSQSIATILETAGLVHDIGNPPFGHFGEDTIQRYFKELLERSKVEKSLRAAQFKIEKDKDNKNTLALSVTKFLFRERQNMDVVANEFAKIPNKEKQADFTRFDGNVQGLRILRHLGLSSDHNSFNLTMPTMATIIKYPHSSNQDNSSGGHSCEKYGYYQEEKDTYEEICKTLHLQKGKRHPLAYLLEAADDIVNVTSDVEDGCKMGIIGYDDLKNKAKGLQNKNLHFDTIKKYVGDQSAAGNCSVGIPDELVIKEFRIRAAHALIEEAVDVFVNNIYDIIADSYFSENDVLMRESKNPVLGEELLKNSELRIALKDLQQMTYQDTYVLKSELLGEHVITTMLDKFIGCMFSNNMKKKGNGKFILNTKSAEGKLYALISPNYKRAFDCAEDEVPADPYDRFLLAVDHVSGMTDSYIVDLYNELTNSRF